MTATWRGGVFPGVRRRARSRGLADADCWVGVSWGLVAAFVQWQLAEGTHPQRQSRLSTVKTYSAWPRGRPLSRRGCGPDPLRRGYSRRAGRHWTPRVRPRAGREKGHAGGVTAAQVRLLKQQPETAQGIVTRW